VNLGRDSAPKNGEKNATSESKAPEGLETNLPMRILIRTSYWAIWARRLANLALPLTILPLLMHRFGYLTSDTFLIIELVAVAVAGLALLLSLGGFVRIWSTGDRGWGLAIAGLLLSLVCLAPAALAGYAVWHFPDIRQVSTDTANPLALPTDPNWPPLPPEKVKRVEAVFPNARTRHYALETLQVFEMMKKLVQQHAWTLIAATPPSAEIDEGRIEAEATTLAGWRHEVAIRVVGDPDGATVDMRSASTTDIHDLGANGQRIEEFLGALDVLVTAQMRDAPANASPPDNGGGDTSPPDAAPIPAPAR
jgi:hypothetical protein